MTSAAASAGVVIGRVTEADGAGADALAAGLATALPGGVAAAPAEQAPRRTRAGTRSTDAAEGLMRRATNIPPAMFRSTGWTSLACRRVRGAIGRPVSVRGAT